MTGLGLLFFLIAGIEGPSILKEDVVAIKKIQMEQRAVKMAHQLKLSKSQIDSLKSIRTSVDSVKAKRTQSKGVLEQKYAPIVKDIRAIYESGATPDSSKLDQLKELRREKRALRREFNLKMKLATLDLAGVLTEDQMAQLRKAIPRHIKQKGVDRKNKENRKRGFARIVLSDAFLSAL